MADAALAGHARELVSAVIDPGHRTVTQEIEHSIRMLMPEGARNNRGSRPLARNEPTNAPAPPRAREYELQ